jgi:hypothetical protein
MGMINSLSSKKFSVGAAATLGLGMWGGSAYERGGEYLERVPVVMVADAHDIVVINLGRAIVGLGKFVDSALTGNGNDEDTKKAVGHKPSNGKDSGLQTPEIGENWINFLQTDFGMSRSKALKCYRANKLASKVLVFGEQYDNPCN